MLEKYKKYDILLVGASNYMFYTLEQSQKIILNLIAKKYPELYLVGGTAISLLYHHRISEDLDFFTQYYSSKLHREVAAFIKKETGFNFNLIEEEKRKRYIPMAVYEFEVGKNIVLKVDFVSDYVKLLQERRKNGMASVEDIYYRKMLAAIGWKAGQSETGQLLAGGRQKAKDVYDIFFLSCNVERLNTFFSEHFDLSAYERLSAWYLGIPKQKTIMELLELVPGCDTRAVFTHLDNEIIRELYQGYAA